MNFGELVSETAYRGFTDLLDEGTQEARLKRWVNEAAREIDDLAPWPYLNASQEGTMAMEIEDLAHVLSVSDLAGDTILYPLDERGVTERDPDRDDTGAAEYWFQTDLTHIDVWPTDTTSTFVVRYVRRSTGMTEDEDEPLSPSTYHELIVEGAVVRCERNRDNYEAGQFVRQEWEHGVNGMKHALLKPNYDHALSIVRTGDYRDYLG